MLYDNRQKVRTPPECLRELLGQLEAQLGKLDYSTADELLQIPVWFDDAHRLLDDLQSAGIALAGERVRLESLGEQFKRKAPRFMRGIGGAAALARVREPRAPDTARWWWFIDEWVAAHKQAQVRRRLKRWGMAVGVLGMLAGLYMLFLAPDAATRNHSRHQQEAERLAQAGDYVTALAEIEAALGFAPDVAEVYVWRGVLLALLGRAEEAEGAFVTAQALAPDRITFLALRSQTYVHLRLPDMALADAQAMIVESPESADGYLLQGRAYHMLREYTLASESYQKTAELASVAGDTALEAMARVQLAYLIQERMGGGE